MTLDEFYYEQDFLEHHGIKGQRWGIRRTPEQLGHYIKKKQFKSEAYQRLADKYRKKGNAKGYNKALEKKRKVDSQIEKAMFKLPKAQYKQERWEEKQARKEERREAKKTKELDKLVKSSDINEILKRQDELNESQLQEVINRANKQRAITEVERQKKNDKFNAAINFGENIVKGFNKYEDVARVVNKITGENTLTVFSDKGKAEKNRIINSMDYNTIMANRNKLSSDELNKALDILHKGRGKLQQEVITTMQLERDIATSSITARNTDRSSAMSQKSRYMTAKSTAESTANSRRITAEEAEQTAREALTAKRQAEINEATARQAHKDAIKRADRMAATGNTTATATLRAEAAARAHDYEVAQEATRRARRNVNHTAEIARNARNDYEESQNAIKEIDRKIAEVDSRISSYDSEIRAANDFINSNRSQVWHYGS